MRKRNGLPRLIWGPVPIINFKFLSGALKEFGFESKTIMDGYLSINNKEDFDLYCSDIVNTKKNVLIHFLVSKFYNFRRMMILDYVLKNADIVHITCAGGFLQNTKYWRDEANILKMAGVKIVVLPYGADYYRYSEVEDTVLRHCLQLSYPAAAIDEIAIKEKVAFWVKNADCFIPSHAIDGIGRWDLIPFSYLCVGLSQFNFRRKYSNADGINDVVKVIHTPNHRGVKGTEFLIRVIEELQSEGFKVELILVEGKKNDEVLKLLREADILAEQFVFSAYALSGIEGMASGLPVLTNLDNETYTRLFRLYSYLNECPILSTSIENIKQNLKILIRNPDLRKTLGLAGIEYVTKYHSNKSAQYQFSEIYKKIWNNEETDLLRMFEPLNPNSYNNRSPIVGHPLSENKIPCNLLNTLNI